MSASTGVRLALWLAWRGLRAHPRETGLRTTVSVAAVVVLLLGCALQPTALARSERTAGAIVQLSAQPAGSLGVRATVDDDWFEGTPVRLVTVTSSPASPTYDGMLLPRPGELVLSPAMAALRADHPELVRRYPGAVVGAVPPDRMIGPRALVVWRGVTAEDLPSGAGWLTTDGKPPVDVATAVPDELAYGYPLIVLGFLLPLFALVGLLSSLGGARREQRLAALRLVGLTDNRAKLSAALEDGLLSTMSVAAGTLVAVVGLPLLGPVVPVLGGVWPGDVRIAWTVAGPLLAAFPLVSVGTSLAGLRMLATSPLGVERRSVRRPLRARRVLPLLLGALLLVAGLVDVTGPPAVRAPVLLAATGLLMLGLATALPYVVRTAARGAVRRGPSLPTLLAARRSLADTGRTARVAVGLTLMVAVSGPLMVFFPLIADLGTPGLQRLANQVGPTTLTTTVGAVEGSVRAGRAAERAWRDIEAGPGVRERLRLSVLTVALTADPATRPRVMAVDCARLATVAHVDPDECARGLAAPGLGSALAGAEVRAVRDVVRADGSEASVPVGPAFRLPGSPVPSAAVAHLDAAGSTGAVLLVPASSVPAGVPWSSFPHTELVVPEPGAVEAVRTAILQHAGTTALSAGERHEIAGRTTREFRLVALAAAVLIAVIAGFATMVTAYEQVRATRHERLLLSIGGAPRRLLDRAALLQVTAPAVGGVLGATGVSLLLALGFTRLMPYAEIAVPLSAVLVVAATGLLTPFVAALAVLRLSASTTVVGDQT